MSGEPTTSSTGLRAGWEQHSPGKDDQPVQRPKTIWPYLAAILSAAAGVTLGLMARSQINSGEGVPRLIGYWNILVTVVYAWLTLCLALRRQNALRLGLGLSQANIGWVGAQLLFWHYVSELTGWVQLDEMATLSGMVFFFVNIVLLGVMRMTGPDLLPPLRAEDVPGGGDLLAELGRTIGISDAERDLIVDLRKQFVSYMSQHNIGGIEVDTWHRGYLADVVLRPGLFPAPLRVEDARVSKGEQWRPGAKTYRFRAILEPKDPYVARKPIHYLIGITAPEAVVRSFSGSKRAGLYLLRNGIHSGRRSSQFEAFYQQRYGAAFRDQA